MDSALTMLFAWLVECDISVPFVVLFSSIQAKEQRTKPARAKADNCKNQTSSFFLAIACTIIGLVYRPNGFGLVSLMKLFYGAPHMAPNGI